MSRPVTHTWEVSHATATTAARRTSIAPATSESAASAPTVVYTSAAPPAPREHSASSVALGTLACALIAAGAWVALRRVSRAVARAWGPLRAYLSARERRAKLRDRGDAHQLVATTAATLAEQVRELSIEIQRLRVKAGEAALLPAPVEPE